MMFVGFSLWNLFFVISAVTGKFNWAEKHGNSLGVQKDDIYTIDTMTEILATNLGWKNVFSQNEIVPSTSNELLWSTSNWKMSYKIEFDLQITNKNINKNVQVFYLTSNGKPCCDIGSRIPFLKLDKRGKMEICTYLIENGNECILVPGTKTKGQKQHVEITQIGHFFTVKIDGVIKAGFAPGIELMNTIPKIFPFVEFYLKDDFSPYAELSNLEIMVSKDKEKGTDEYIPGNAGGPWTSEEIDIVREKIHGLMSPIAEEKIQMFGKRNYFPWTYDGPISENTLIRLAFHDCLKYSMEEGGDGGCDGCLNWEGMGSRLRFSFPAETGPQDKTDNNDLARLVYFLEKIYIRKDWPKGTPSLSVTLKESGKSRADLWAFAGLVALERAIERANWACEYDFNVRQQITLLEGRDKCDIKLTKPMKFQYGRKDCITENAFPFITSKKEEHPSKHDAIQIFKLMKRDFGMTARHFLALAGIHSLASNVDQRTQGTKYSWFGAAYLSNKYYKLIANKPTYLFDNGGDVVFLNRHFEEQLGGAFYDYSIGNKAGEPIANTGWRVSCMTTWNTTDGGPCFFRPTTSLNTDNPIYHGGTD